MKKRILSLALVVMMVFSLFPLTAAAADIVDSGSCGSAVRWTLDSDGVLTISGEGAISSHPWDSSAVKTVVIESGVTSIGNYAFYYCDNLTSVTIPDSVTSIGENAFYRCFRLKSVTLPAALTSLGAGAFYDCSKLESAVIPEGVESIEDNTFYSCSSLTSVTIPDSVTTVKYNAFSGCEALKRVVISDLSAWCSISFGYGFSNPLYYAHELYLNDQLITELVIPDDVTSIKMHAFCGARCLTSLTIGPNVETIESDAFSECKNLQTVFLNDGLQKIESYAFKYCSSLADVYFDGTQAAWNAITIESDNDSLLNATLHVSGGIVDSGSCGENVTWTLDKHGVLTISGEGLISSRPWDGSAVKTVVIESGVKNTGNNTFYGCANLTSVTIPSSVTSIGNYAFDYCSSLTSVTIPDSVTSIGQCAFRGCSSLTSVTIPDSVTSIGGYAFQNCGSLTIIAIPEGVASIETCTFLNCTSLTSITIPSSVTSIGDNAFYSCSGLTSVEIPSSVTSIGSYAFRDCTSLTEIKLPNSVRSIGSSAFSGCAGLTSAMIPDRVTSIATGTFENCTSLTEIRIPSRVTSIGDYAFCGCNVLTSIMIPSSVTSIESYAFQNCTSLTDVYFAGTGSAWNAISIKNGNSPLLNAARHYITCGECGENVWWMLDENGVLTISGTGPMTDYDTTDSPFDSNSDIQSVVIGSGVTSIGFDAFYGCDSMTSIEIPSSVTIIGDYAFCSCSSLTSVTIPTSVESIGNSVFNGCRSLTEINVPEGNPNYQSNQGVMLNKSGTELICCPGGMTGDYSIPDSVTSIGNNAFFRCSGLTSVTIPSGVTSIGNNAFFSCSSLTDVYYDGTQAAWNAISIGSSNASLLNAALHVIQTELAITQQPQDVSGAVGETVTVSVAATGEGLSYQWQYRQPGKVTWYNSGMAGSDTDTLQIPVTAKRDGQSYRCVITDANGDTVTSDAATLTIAAPQTELAITQQPQDVSGAVGETVTVSVAATGEGLSYQWQYRQPGKTMWYHSSMTGSTTDTLQIPVTAKRDGQSYRCVITDETGASVTSDAATLTIAAPQTPLAITQQPQDVSGAVGETVSVSVAATGEGLSYQWQYRQPGKTMWYHSSMTGSTTDTLQIPVTAKRDGQSYRCVITDETGASVTSDAATLTIGEPQTELVITQQPQDVSGAVGETVTVSVAAAGEGLSYQWQYRQPGKTTWYDSGMTGSTTDTLQIPVTAKRNGQSYRCVITDQYGAKIISEACVLTVQP